jgi:hypothetical protein
MPSAVRLREDYSVEELRTRARQSRDVCQSRRLLSLAAVRDGMDRAAAAKIGRIDRQTLRDWVHRFNASGPEGLIDNRTEGPKANRRSREDHIYRHARLSPCQSVTMTFGITRITGFLRSWCTLIEVICASGNRYGLRTDRDA